MGRGESVGRRGWQSTAELGRRLPSDDADELTWLLFTQDDVISLDQALRQMSRKAVRHRVATGRWRQVHRRVFVTHNGPVTGDQLRWIAVLAIGEPAVLGGLTAAQAGGLRRYGSSAIHILVPAARRMERTPLGAIVHRTPIFDEVDILPVGQPPRTMPGRSLVDAAQWAHSDDAYTSRSMAANIWMPGSHGLTCGGRTNCGSPATACFASRPGRYATNRPGSSPN